MAKIASVVGPSPGPMIVAIGGPIRVASGRVLGGDYFSDGDLGDLRSKEAALALQGVWIIELAEGEIFSRATSRALKAFVTKEFDDIIPKYSNDRRRIPRQSVFALTTNDTADYLTDRTGNRRFWPVLCTQIDLEGLKDVRDQLLAEAFGLLLAGAKWWPTTEAERQICTEEQNARVVHDVWVEPIRRGLRRTERTTIAEVLADLLDIDPDKQARREQLRAADCLRSLGWVEGPRSNTARTWVRGPDAEPMAGEGITKELLDELVRKGEHLKLVEDPDLPIDDDTSGDPGVGRAGSGGTEK